MNRVNRNVASYLLLLLIAVGWPPIYSLYIHPHLQQRIESRNVSTDELMNLLHAKRYTIEIPPELDGQVLTLDVTVDGETTQGGGTTVEGGSTVVLLLRRDQKSRKIEYCWSAGSTLARGVLDDPLSDAGVTSWRNEGPIKPGDWLLRGGKECVNVFPATEPAEFELRLAFQSVSAD